MRRLAPRRQAGGGGKRQRMERSLALYPSVQWPSNACKHAAPCAHLVDTAPDTAAMPRPYRLVYAMSTQASGFTLSISITSYMIPAAQGIRIGSWDDDASNVTFLAADINAPSGEPYMLRLSAFTTADYCGSFSYCGACTVEVRLARDWLPLAFLWLPLSLPTTSSSLYLLTTS